MVPSQESIIMRLDQMINTMVMVFFLLIAFFYCFSFTCQVLQRTLYLHYVFNPFNDSKADTLIIIPFYRR